MVSLSFDLGHEFGKWIWLLRFASLLLGGASGLSTLLMPSAGMATQPHCYPIIKQILAIGNVCAWNHIAVHCCASYLIMIIIDYHVFAGWFCFSEDTLLCNTCLVYATYKNKSATANMNTYLADVIAGVAKCFHVHRLLLIQIVIQEDVEAW